MSIQLVVGNTDVKAVSFQLTCDAGIELSGEFNVNDEEDPPVWGVIMDLPVGDCSIAITASDDNGEPLCTGSGDFTVVPNETVKVSLVLTCIVEPVDESGNVEIDATFETVVDNQCPDLFFFNAVPDEVPAAGSSITVLAKDPDGDPLSIELAATNGSFVDPSSPATTYTCDDAVGEQTLFVIVGDGDCQKMKSFQVTCEEAESPCVSLPGCELVWADEFDGDSVDTSKWELQTGDGTELGIPGWGNNELQWYTEDNATVGGGVLTIQAREESVGGYAYTSSRLRSLGRGDWTYGRFEMRARLPEGQGLWPAFWMLSSDPSIYGVWAASGEIDIMESIGSEPERVFGTIHYGDTFPGNLFSSTSTFLPPGTEGDFHEYAVEWREGEIRWYLDGALYSVRNDWFSTGGPFPAPFDVDFHLLLNLAVGGNLPGSPDATTVFPQEFVIDYVRVYQQP
ncbi:MAG: glycoside hydrolase family 16 protein [Myxococcota bacterium]